ncbi:MAG: ATP synthase F1 subunit gamma [Candidatus Magasanikbacteria bacterium]|nr:ATP synthase F1 subunit gamma [Candidatus Magasanikbacteria bacterium]|tara:strand:+ start:4727 stop:5680 length:954 start_codon:yes stop_codon:yes gene_type:complete
MPVSTKEIKGRIKSVQNTKKITKAMEMVSAAKMKKAVDAAQNTRIYATRALGILDSLAEVREPDCPLIQKRTVEKVLVVVMSSNKGLCGGFNANIIKKVRQVIEQKDRLLYYSGDGNSSGNKNKEMVIDVLGIGRKSVPIAKKCNIRAVAVFDDISEQPGVNDVYPISSMIQDLFVKEEYDKVVMVYTHFVSGLEQVPKVRQLLPVSSVDLHKILEEDFVSDDVKKESTLPIACYHLEPTREDVLNAVLPMLLGAQIHHGVLESAASEHSARMVAMKNAGEAAGEMQEELTQMYNKARQAAITQEIAEIAGGAAALE